MSKKARSRSMWKKPRNHRPWKNRKIKGYPWPWSKYWDEEVRNRVRKEVMKSFQLVGDVGWGNWP